MTHPDDDLLSALIDGEAAPSDVEHTDACPACQSRLAQLRAAAQLAARPVGDPPPGARDRAVAVALAAAAPVPRAAAWWQRPAVLAAAAVIALFAIAAPVVVSAVGGDDDDDVALVSPAGGPVVAGDLGDLAGGDTLEERVRTALSEPGAGGRAARPETAGDDASAGSEAAESGAAALSAAVVDPVEAATRCEPAVRAGNADLAALAFLATGAWDGTPAVVMGFARPGDQDGVSLYVLDAATCDILNWQRF